jgi:serine/threonine protein kinase
MVVAPEVIELTGATPASDIWSVGCTVIELLDGRPPYHKLDPMPALFRIVNDEHPPLPEGASPAVRDFLLQCFQKDPNFRVSARKLLKHPWVAGVNAKKPASTMEDIGATTKFEDAVRSVQQWNEAIKSPGGGQSEARSVQGQGNTPREQRTNLRAGVVAGMSMTPPKFRESVIDKQIAGGAKTDPFRSPESSRIIHGMP